MRYFWQWERWNSNINYLEYCRNAFIIKKVSKSDTVGKKILSIDEK